MKAMHKFKCLVVSLYASLCVFMIEMATDSTGYLLCKSLAHLLPGERSECCNTLA